jgi:HD-like signal output (HDOD) protein
MDGASLLTEVQRRFPESIRIILSGQTEQDALVQANVVAHTILGKPCDAETVYNVLKGSLEIQSRLGDPEIRRIVASGRSIPVSPGSIRDVLALLRKPDVSIEQITEIVKRDLGLYGYIIKLINSSHYGMRSRVYDIDQAILLLGTSPLRTILCGLKLANALSPSIDENLCTDVLQSGIQRAQRVLRIVHQHRKPKLFSDECYVAALFQDFGKLVLSVSLGNRYEKIIDLTRGSTTPLVVFEREALQCTHAEVGAYLLSLWSFSPQVIRSVCSHEDRQDVPCEVPETIVDFVRLSSQQESEKP